MPKNNHIVPITFGPEIKSLSTNEAIRKRPTMYVGKLDNPKLPTNLILEACCKALDDANGGLVTKLTIRLSPGYVNIIDNGPGWDTTSQKDKPYPVRIMQDLFACKNEKPEELQKFCQMGITVTNALCLYASVNICSINECTEFLYHYDYSFEKGRHIWFDATGAPTANFNSDELETGTNLYLELDDSILPSTEIVADYLKEKLDEMFCGSGCEVSIIDQRK